MRTARLKVSPIVAFGVDVTLCIGQDYIMATTMKRFGTLRSDIEDLQTRAVARLHALGIKAQAITRMLGNRAEAQIEIRDNAGIVGRIVIDSSGKFNIPDAR